MFGRSGKMKNDLLEANYPYEVSWWVSKKGARDSKGFNNYEVAHTFYMQKCCLGLHLVKLQEAKEIYTKQI